MLGQPGVSRFADSPRRRLLPSPTLPVADSPRRRRFSLSFPPPCHSRESGNPAQCGGKGEKSGWIPAFAGMTGGENFFFKKG